MTFDCDCPECLMEQIPEPEPGFGAEALRSLWTTHDPEVAAICKGCREQGDCVYDGDRSARVMCQVVIKEVRP